MIKIDFPTENETLKSLEFIDKFLCESISAVISERATTETETLTIFMDGVAYGYRQTLQLIRVMEFNYRKEGNTNE